MIQLIKLIPEIKIQPNNTLPKKGNVYYLGDVYSPGEYKIDFLGVNYITLTGVDDPMAQSPFYSMDEFLKLLKDKKIKFIRQDLNEIKINPRNKIITNNQLYDFLEPNLEDFVKFLDYELGWNIAIFDNHLDLDENDYIVLITIGDREEERYASIISINNDLEDLVSVISEINYKGIKMFIGV